MKALGYIFATLIGMIYCALLHGWALAKLWAWFIVPTFTLPPLTLPTAIGLSLVVSYLTHQRSRAPKDQSFAEALCDGLSYATANTAIALLFGYVVRLWM